MAKKLGQGINLDVNGSFIMRITDMLGQSVEEDIEQGILDDLQTGEYVIGFDSKTIIGEFNMDWDLAYIKPLFEKLGCRIIAVFTGGERLENLLKIPDARLNVLHCQRSCTYISDLIKEGFDVPYVNASFFGIEQTAKALREVAEFFGSEEMK